VRHQDLAEAPPAAALRNADRRDVSLVEHQPEAGEPDDALGPFHRRGQRADPERAQKLLERAQQPRCQIAALVAAALDRSGASVGRFARRLGQLLVRRDDDGAARLVVADLPTVGRERPGSRETLPLNAADLLEVFDPHRSHDVRHARLHSTRPNPVAG
jgi:hypothetical protein